MLLTTAPARPLAGQASLRSARPSSGRAVLNVIPEMFLRDIRDRRRASGFGAWTNVYSSCDLPPDSHRLCRVMSIEMFKKQVTKGVNFTRVDKFFDEFEGTIPMGSRMPPGFSNVWRDLRQLSSVSCWTLSKIESDLFAEVDKNGGNKREVGIETTIGELCAALGWPSGAQIDNNVVGWRSPVLYMDEYFGDVVDEHLVSRALFWKQEMWSRENEYRFVFTKFRDYIRRLHDKKRMLQQREALYEKYGASPFNLSWNSIYPEFLARDRKFPIDRFLPLWYWMQADFSAYTKQITLRCDAEKPTIDFVTEFAQKLDIPVTHLRS
jgi:hypothetical protein